MNQKIPARQSGRQYSVEANDRFKKMKRKSLTNASFDQWRNRIESNSTQIMLFSCLT